MTIANRALGHLTLLICALCILPWLKGGLWLPGFILFFVVGVILFLNRLLDADFRCFLKRLYDSWYCWCLALFLIFIFVQGLNPAWAVDGDFYTGQWVLNKTKVIAFLPQGVEAPFVSGNAWYILIQYLAMALWGLILFEAISEKNVSILIFSFAANFVLLGLIGLFQKLVGANALLFLWEDIPSYFFSSFTYKNHAGAFFNLGLGVIASLLLNQTNKNNIQFWSYRCGLLVVQVAVFYTMSKGAVLLSLGILLAYWGVRISDLKEFRANRFQFLAQEFLAIIILCIVVKASSLDSKFIRLNQDFENVTSENMEQTNVSIRLKLFEATWNMFKDEAIWGWGAGSYKYAFPLYQSEFTEHLVEAKRDGLSEHSRVYLVHSAHNDWLQYLCEFGVIGCLLLWIPLLALSINFAKFIVRGGKKWLPLIVSLLVVLVHASFDFPFQNPAILITWFMLSIYVLRLITSQDEDSSHLLL